MSNQLSGVQFIPFVTFLLNAAVIPPGEGRTAFNVMGAIVMGIVLLTRFFLGED